MYILCSLYVSWCTQPGVCVYTYIHVYVCAYVYIHTCLPMYILCSLYVYLWNINICTHECIFWAHCIYSHIHANVYPCISHWKTFHFWLSTSDGAGLSAHQAQTQFCNLSSLKAVIRWLYGSAAWLHGRVYTVFTYTQVYPCMHWITYHFWLSPSVRQSWIARLPVRHRHGFLTWACSSK